MYTKFEKEPRSMVGRKANFSFWRLIELKIQILLQTPRHAHHVLLVMLCLAPSYHVVLYAQDPDPEPVCCGIPGIIKPGGNIGICMPFGRFWKLKL